MNMIIGRRQIVLAALVLALGTAIFLNYKFSGGAGSIAGVFHGTSALGDASYVDNQKVSGASSSTSSSNDVFAQTRLSRQQARETAEQALKTLVTASGTTVTSQTQQQINTAIQSIENNYNAEQSIENLVMAKGFTQCVAMINTKTGEVNVVVKPKSGDSLSSSEAAQIMDIAKSQTKFASTNIHIIPAK